MNQLQIQASNISSFLFMLNHISFKKKAKTLLKYFFSGTDHLDPIFYAVAVKS